MSFCFCLLMYILACDFFFPDINILKNMIIQIKMYNQKQTYVFFTFAWITSSMFFFVWIHMVFLFCFKQCKYFFSMYTIAHPLYKDLLFCFGNRIYVLLLVYKSVKGNNFYLPVHFLHHNINCKNTPIRRTTIINKMIYWVKNIKPYRVYIEKIIFPLIYSDIFFFRLQAIDDYSSKLTL